MLISTVLLLLFGGFGDGRRLHPTQGVQGPSGVGFAAPMRLTQNLLRTSTPSSVRQSHANLLTSGGDLSVLQTSTHDARIGPNMIMRDQEVMPKPEERGYKRARFKSFFSERVPGEIEDQELSLKPGERGYKRARFKSFLGKMLRWKKVGQAERLSLHPASNDAGRDELQEAASNATGALVDRLAGESPASDEKATTLELLAQESALNATGALADRLAGESPASAEKATTLELLAQESDLNATGTLVDRLAAESPASAEKTTLELSALESALNNTGTLVDRLAAESPASAEKATTPELSWQESALNATGTLADRLAAESSASAENATTLELSAPEHVRKLFAEEMRKALRDDVYEHFGSQLGEYEKSWLTDEILGIYVRAKQTPRERLEFLVKALEWRISNRDMLQMQKCSYCLRDPLSHDARLFGFDKVGDFLFMNCFELPRDISVDSVTCHIACLLELALKQYPLSSPVPIDDDGHPKVRQWTFIFDLHGFGLRYYDPRVTVSLLQLFQVVHRGRVKKLIVMDAPKIFWGFWKLVKPFLRKSTVKKLEFSDWTTIRPDLEENFGKDLTAELLAEAAENRDPARAATKTWTTFYGPSLSQARQANDIDLNVG